MTARRAAASGLIALAWAGCALTSKSDPMQFRHFTPEPSATPTVGGEQRASASELSLALGRVNASAHLRERIAYRASPNEIGYYETRRWTERPENYLRRAVSRELFERRGIGRLVSGSGPTLELELLAFEEVHEPTRVARLQVVIVLHGGGQPSFERTISIERPIVAGEDAAVA